MNGPTGTLDEKSQPAPRVLPPDTQQECIDLPGEEVRCVVRKPKLEIMLRKHRDVVFDVRLFKGMQYTVEAYEGDFYNARDKKIVLRARRQKVIFTDGERLHLWVGRGFRGSLILKANGKVLGRYRPADLDRQHYDSDPRRTRSARAAIQPAPTCRAGDAHRRGQAERRRHARRGGGLLQEGRRRHGHRRGQAHPCGRRSST
jgi:hypothetical protein